MSGAFVLSHPVGIADLPSAPVEIVARPAEREALAAAYDLVAVDSLAATVSLAPAPGGGVMVEGHVVADIVQTCVVSLVPVSEHIDETFSVLFVRDPGRLHKPGAEIVVDPAAPDPPELLEGPTLDVGGLAEEYFALAINPYPRAPDAALPADIAVGEGAEKQSPFAILAALAKSPSGKG